MKTRCLSCTSWAISKATIPIVRGVVGRAWKFGLDLARSNSKFRHVTCASGRFEKVSNPSLASRERIWRLSRYSNAIWVTDERSKALASGNGALSLRAWFRTRLIRVFELVSRVTQRVNFPGRGLLVGNSVISWTEMFQLLGWLKRCFLFSF